MNQKLSASSSSPTHVVGIGASAGGLESLEKFFRAVPHDTGMAFVVIQHLAPDHKSLMSELLRKHTPMSVVPATHGAPVTANRVYLIPPKHNVEVRDARLVLTQRMDHPHRRPNYAVDQFFRSLALDYAERALGVVLSGTGSDGAHGSAAIKAAGGVVLAENPETAKFGTMPTSTIKTGVVAGVADAAELPSEILRHVGLLETRTPPPPETLETIVAAVSTHTGIDFSMYKRATVTRRIDRRRVATDCDTLEHYAQLIHTTPEERAILGRDLLVGVTAFFRDPGAYEVLNAQLEPLVRAASARSDNTLRVWTAACSTGEEAYSVAICCLEAIRRLRLNVTLKVFATDVNEDALATAGRGRYIFSACTEISTELKDRYFTSDPDAYTVRASLRESVVFARHDILCDPPFTRIDLLSCRNMMIYLGNAAQLRARKVFRFALRTDGVLFLGMSETLGSEDAAFETIDDRHSLYRSLPAGRRSDRSFSVRADTLDSRMDTPLPSIAPARPRSPVITADPGAKLLEATLKSIGCSALVLNASGGLAYAFGAATSLLSVPSGRTGWRAADLLAEEARIVVLSAVEQALADNRETMIESVRLHPDMGALTNVRAVPLGGRGAQLGAAVLFDRAASENPIKRATPLSIDDAVQARVRQLEEQVRRIEARLVTTVEELESSNEELQATNEELIASNEELQSTNEELQSLNEELHTVNAELQVKVEELSVLSGDLTSLLRTMGGGLLFLDVNGHIRRHNAAIREVIPLLPQDEGRPIGDIAHELQGVDFDEEIAHVLSTAVGLERDVRSRANKTYRFVVHPFSNGQSRDAIDGIVITLTDITALATTRDLLSAYEELFEASPIESTILDLEGELVYANRAFASAMNDSIHGIVGRNIRDFIGAQTDDKTNLEFRKALEGKHPWTGSLWLNNAPSADAQRQAEASLNIASRPSGEPTHFGLWLSPANAAHS